MGKIPSGQAGGSAVAGTEGADLAQARTGDAAAFTRLVAPLRPELHAHCYRMLGSAHDADDAVQDALLRAWRGLAGFEERSSLRTWLHTVATRTCLDLAETRGKRAMPMDLGPSSDRAVIQGNAPLTDVAWLSPYPDTGVGQGSASPEARYEQREAVELAFVAALQHLSGNQRAALLLFDVLGFSAAEIAETMQTSATSVNSALARARRTIQEKVPAPTQQQTLRTIGDSRLQELVTGFATALESGDPEAFVALLTEDVTWSMPPLPHWYRGRAAVTHFAVEVPMTRCPSWRYLATSANGQPAVAFYLGAQASGPHHAWSITILTLRGTRIAEITSFLEPSYFTAFGLPPRCPDGERTVMDGWCSVEELTRFGFAQSPVVMANEAHSGLARCVRTRDVGVRMIQAAYQAGVRRLAMEALPSLPNDPPEPIREVPSRDGGYLAQPDMRRLITTALELGWSLWAYEVTIDDLPESEAERLSLEFTNWREREQAKNLCRLVAAAPKDPLLVWCGNGHAYREGGNGWVPMGHHFAATSGIQQFVIDQTVTVDFTRQGPDPWVRDLLAELGGTLTAHGGCAGILCGQAPAPLDRRPEADAVIVSTENELT